jgi:hypothetical protein
MNPYLLAVIAVWEIIWKGFAMWKAARHSQKNWFIAILLLNTAGILPIVYLYFFQKNKKEETKEIIQKKKAKSKKK